MTIPQQAIEAEFDRARLRLADDLLEEHGLLDPDQPTQTAHLDWIDKTFGEIRPTEFTPLQRAIIRREFSQEKP